MLKMTDKSKNNIFRKKQNYLTMMMYVAAFARVRYLTHEIVHSKMTISSSLLEQPFPSKNSFHVIDGACRRRRLLLRKAIRVS